MHKHVSRDWDGSDVLICLQKSHIADNRYILYNGCIGFFRKGGIRWQKQGSCEMFSECGGK